ncbi:MAG TPA: GNAT family N-acetyltransferase [Candidatus Elarobacter sp.]|jgi:GNAT superfamily N-acetyltransferase|nr:GNAT family N-acetyltransferase [Candidatus Elarobacter sp.]
MIECRTMAGAERFDAFALMKRFRSDEAALGDALALFVDRPDYGFVWLAYDDGIPAGCVSVAFAISTETGGLVAELRDLYVAEERRRRGIGSALLATLHGRLDHLDVTRVEAAVPDDPALRGFFSARGYDERGGAVFMLDRR